MSDRLPLLSLVCLVLAAPISDAQEERVLLLGGTNVYVELDETVSSKEGEVEEGDIVRGHVWRHVLVGGHTVIAAGTPVTIEVAHVESKSFAGGKGSIDLEALSVRAVDGTEILLQGGYGEVGKGRAVMRSGLSMIAWPAKFIPGKDAVLSPGTLFTSEVEANALVGVFDRLWPRQRVGEDLMFKAEVLYDELFEQKKPRTLPLRMTLCDAPLTEPAIVAVNDRQIERLPIVLAVFIDGKGCTTADGTVPLKALSEHFGRGINRFDIQAGEHVAPVMVDIEL